MSDQQTAVHQPAAAEAEMWGEDDFEELPPRPRRRLLAPLPLALLGVLLIACGFIAGVLVEKGQTSSSSSGGSGAAGLAARFASLRGASGAGSGASAGAGTAPTGAAGGFGAGGSGGARGATVGQVAYVAGSTLYVTTAEGNTVKVKTSEASTVTKTVTASVKSIRPGETVVVTGASGANGQISAESIRVGGAGGGLGSLFGGGGSATGGTGAGSGNGGRGSSGGGEPALFGKGG